MITELTDPELPKAVAAMAELRPHVAELELAMRTQRAAGYRVAGVFVDGEDAAVAVAGFRVHTNLAWGRHLYVDDLVTREAFRGQGHGRALMGWLIDFAQQKGCEQLHLDSGTGANRHDAHALYHASGLRISSHHFQRPVPKVVQAIGRPHDASRRG